MSPAWPAKKTASFRKALLSWYGENKRELPWRKTRDPYAIWISEVMLQQTRVDTVLPYYLNFMEKYPDLKSLAMADPEALLKSWEGLGYYKRLQNLRKTAVFLVDNLDGLFPENLSELKKLPGIGAYTGAALASIAFDEKEAVVDGNVKRVMARLFEDSFPVNANRAHKHFQQYADFLLDPETPGNFNQALMDLGAMICVPGKPLCAKCPVKTLCGAFTSKSQEHFPTRESRKRIPFFKVTCTAILDREKRILVTKRPETGMLPGFWEFPGGKLEKDEHEEAACKRKIFEKTGLTPFAFEHLCTVRHAYTHFRIAMAFFVCHTQKTEIFPEKTREFRWLPFMELKTLAFPAANRKCMAALETWLNEHA